MYKMNLKMVPIEKIRPVEQVFPHHYENLKKMIFAVGYMKYALVVEDKYNIVLDGSNRHLFLALAGFKYAPVHYVDYSDPHVRVGSNRIHRLLINTPVTVTKEEVIRRGTTGDLYPPRTTRHFIPFLRPEINYPLSKLGKRKPIDLSSNIVKISIQKEINHNKHYIKEIEDEITETIHYMEESVRTKEYLKEQIKRMEQCKKQ